MLHPYGASAWFTLGYADRASRRRSGGPEVVLPWDPSVTENVPAADEGKVKPPLERDGRG